MLPSEKIHDYAKSVCAQIHWKKARAVVAEEIENHLVDQRDAYIADGAEEAAATEAAIAQMGDPVAVGTQMDRLHRPRPQWAMLALVGVFLCMWVTFNSYNYGYLDYSWIFEQGGALAFGVAILASTYFLGLSWLGRYPKVLIILLMSFFTAAFVLRETEGILWHFADLVLLLLPLGFVGLVYSLKKRGFIAILICEAVFLAPVLLLFIVEEQWLRSACVLYTACAMVTLCVAVSRGWFRVKKSTGYLLVLLPIVVTILTALVIMSLNGRLERMWGTFHLPYKNDGSYGWEGYFTTTQAVLAGSKFVGHGVMPDGSYFNPGGGFILTGLVYDYGWISLIPILGLLLSFIILGFRRCFRQKSVLGLLVSVSVMVMLTMQTICALLLDFGIYLFSGLSLPFIVWPWSMEYFADMALTGLMLSVFRTGDVLRDRAIPKRRLFMTGS